MIFLAAVLLYCIGTFNIIGALTTSFDESLLFPYARSVSPTGSELIYVISETAIPHQGDQVTIQTLSGLLARDTPRIYTIKSKFPNLTNVSIDNDTTVFWLNDLETHHGIKFSFQYLHDPESLINEFIDEIKGYVIYV